MAEIDSGSRQLRALAIPVLLVTSICAIWLSAVNNYVPEPYMDEIFHIPQAQQYCSGNFWDWDPKLTTPPGLYGFSLLLSYVHDAVYGKPTSRETSRPFQDQEGVDVLEKAAESLVSIGYGCRVDRLRMIGGITLLSMLFLCWKIRAVLSTPATELVGKPDSLCLEEKQAELKAARQMNIQSSFLDSSSVARNICFFPPLFFFSALYYTDVLSTLVVIAAYLVFLLRAGSNSLLSGVAVYLIGVLGLLMRQTNVFWVAIFLGGLEWVRVCEKATISCPQWGNITRGIVVGEVDSSNEEAVEKHRIYQSLADATILDFIKSLVFIAASAITNPIQLVLRLWPYISLLGTFAGFVYWNGGVVLGDKSNHVATIHLPQILYLAAFISFFSWPLYLPTIYRLCNDAVNRRLPSLITILALILATGAALVVVHFNTIIHPFTLADNRHYMFYIFRYTILKHPLIKYALVPVYVVGGWLAFLTLGGEPNAPNSSDEVTKKVPVSSLLNNGRPTVPFTLLLAITTALSLITAPLVEPRYFIIPWVIWRLHVPSARTPATKKIEKAALWIEFFWFLAVNAGTCAVFLFRPFGWENEPGRWQRFMW